MGGSRRWMEADDFERERRLNRALDASLIRSLRGTLFGGSLVHTLLICIFTRGGVAPPSYIHGKSSDAVAGAEDVQRLSAAMQPWSHNPYAAMVSHPTLNALICYSFRESTRHGRIVFQHLVHVP